MTKLEPTRTSSDLTATERLRALLDERGVEWWQSANTLGCIFTRWYSPIFGDEVVAMENGKEGLVLFDHFMTPEQAIAATLGESPRLPHFWTHDGVLHIELPKLPDSIQVRLPDQRDREVGSARTWQFTRDSGTCHDKGGTGANGEQVFNCSECGCVLSLYDRDGSNNLCTSFVYDYPRYCPECGRRIEVTNG